MPVGEIIILKLYHHLVDLISRELDSETSHIIVTRFIFTVFLEKYNLLNASEIENCRDLIGHLEKSSKLAPPIELFKKDITDINLKNPKIFTNLSKIRDYNLDICIFGEIFENTIEKTKAKDTGVFYTPDYITEYISKNTIKKAGVKILDPACGSGAFLIKAVDILYEISPDLDILDCIYGVDIDEMACDISKLSVFLKLTSLGVDFDAEILNENIRCANFLVDYKTNLKFDIIIGNPPYVNIYRISANKSEMKFYQENYISAYKKFDLYVLFLEKSLKMLKKGGILGFIIPNNFLSQPYGLKIRQLMLNSYNIVKIIDLTRFSMFKANTKLIILFIRNSQDKNNVITVERPLKKGDLKKTEINKISQKVFIDSKDSLIRLDLTGDNLSVIDKIKSKSVDLNELCFVGIGTRSIPQSKHHLKEKLDDNAKRLIVGKNVLKYYLDYEGLWLNYIDELYNPMFSGMFENEKIIIRDFLSNNRILLAYDEDNYYTSHTTLCCLLKCQIPEKFDENQLKLSKNFNLKYIFGVLSSNIAEYYFKLLHSNGMHVYVNDLRQIPVLNISKEVQNEFIDIINSILDLNLELYREIKNFHESLNTDKISRKLKSYYTLSYKEFNKHLKRRGIKNNISREMFDESVLNVNTLLLKISNLEDKLNTKFYKLYDFTPEDIETVEKYLDLY